MSAPGLQARQISLRLGRFALREVSLDVPRGEILVLLGPNGAGKSVCLETIAGFHRAHDGRVLIGGRDVTGLPPEKRRIAFVVQNFALFPHLSVAENVAIARNTGVARKDAAELRSTLARFGIAHLAHARPEHLSPGEKQRAALARALASRPDLFLFDEPFCALDAATSESLRDELAVFLRRAGAPAVFVTHDRADALALGDRVAIIEGGTIRQHGATSSVFARPGSIAIARFLGIENLLEGCVAETADELVRIGVGTGSLHVSGTGSLAAPERQVTLCIHAGNVHLLPAGVACLQRPPEPNLLQARVVELRRSGPLWKVSLECGFPLTAYALPQTVRDCALAPGGPVAARIDPCAIHVIPEDIARKVPARMQGSSPTGTAQHQGAHAL